VGIPKKDIGYYSGAKKELTGIIDIIPIPAIPRRYSHKKYFPVLPIFAFPMNRQMWRKTSPLPSMTYSTACTKTKSETN